MTEFSSFNFNEAPEINFINELLGAHELDTETIRFYHSEAVEVAARVCTEAITEYWSGSLRFNRATSRPVQYRGDVFIGLGLTAGPRALYDKTLLESVELGLFTSQGNETSFQAVAILHEDTIKTGGLAKPRLNDPQDLDSFMRGLRYIAQQL